MSTIRVLLDCVGRSTLVRLVRARDVAASRENDERRKTLAHSYRGDVEALIHDLTRQELISLFRQLTFSVGKAEDMRLRNPSKYRLDELQAFAVRAFTDRRVRIPGEFHPASVPEASDDEEAEDEGEEEAEDEGEEEAEDEEEEGGDDDESHDDDQGDDVDEDTEAENPFKRLTEEWSRPRQIDRLLRLLGDEPPARLRSKRFQELLGRLLETGVEACLADDASCVPLEMRGAESPGIAAKLRLRRVTKRTQWGRAAGRAARPAADAGPAIVVHPGERPISQGAPRPSNYKLALLRLKFLTAVPSVARERMAAWPEAHLAAAARGLDLLPGESKLLRALSTGLAIGNHSPYEVIPMLTQVMDDAEWKQLIDDFVALNPFEPDFVRMVVDLVRPVPAPLTERGAWRSAEPILPPDDFRDAPRTKDPSVAPVAASGRRDASSAPPVEPATNVRDLGPLANMFEDE